MSGEGLVPTSPSHPQPLTATAPTSLHAVLDPYTASKAGCTHSGGTRCDGHGAEFTLAARHRPIRPSLLQSYLLHIWALALLSHEDPVAPAGLAAPSDKVH